MKIEKKKFKNYCHCDKNKKCKLCKGKGYYYDYQYYFTIGNICYSGDTLK